MGLISLNIPTLLQPDSSEEPKVVSNFTALQALLNGGLDSANLASSDGILSTYKDLVPERSVVLTTQGSGSVYILGPAQPSQSTPQVFVALNCPTPGYLFYLDPADWAAGARTTKLRLATWMVTNNVAPQTTFVVGLYPVTATSYLAPGLLPVISTLGAVVAGSTVTYAVPAAVRRLASVSADFVAPAAGFYVLGVAITGTGMATDAVLSVAARLQLRQV